MNTTVDLAHSRCKYCPAEVVASLAGRPGGRDETYPRDNMASTTGGTGWLFASLRGYSTAWLPGDTIAALPLAAIAIPEQLAAGLIPHVIQIIIRPFETGAVVQGADRALRCALPCAGSHGPGAAALGPAGACAAGGGTVGARLLSLPRCRR